MGRYVVQYNSRTGKVRDVIAEAGVVFNDYDDGHFSGSGIWLSPGHKYLLVDTFSHQDEDWSDIYHLYLVDIKAGTAKRLTELERGSFDPSDGGAGFMSYSFIGDEIISVCVFYKVEEGKFIYLADVYKVNLPKTTPILVAERLPLYLFGAELEHTLIHLTEYWIYLRYEHAMLNRLTGERLSLDGIPLDAKLYPSPNGKHIMFTVYEEVNEHYTAEKFVGCFNAETGKVILYSGELLHHYFYWTRDDLFYLMGSDSADRWQTMLLEAV